MDEKEKTGERKNNREERVKVKLVISVLSVLTILVADIYVIINLKNDISSIVLLTVMALIAVYFVIDSVMTLSEQKNSKLAQQYEEICQTQKAANLVVNHMFEELEEELTRIEKLMKISTEEIINAQKGTSKVVVNRNKENTEAILQSYMELGQQLETFEQIQAEKLSKLDKISEHIVLDVNKQLELNIQNMMIQMKDMELRLNQLILQNAKVIVPQESMQMEVLEKKAPIENIFLDTAEKEQEKPEIETVYPLEAELEEKLVEVEPSEKIEPPLPLFENKSQTEVENQMDSTDEIERVVEDVGKEVADEIEPFYESGDRMEVEEVPMEEPLSEAEFVQVVEAVNKVEAEEIAAAFEEMKEQEISLSEEAESISEVVFEEIPKIESEIEPKEESELEIEVGPEIQVEEPMLEIDENLEMPDLIVEEPPTDERIPEDITMTEISAEKVTEDSELPIEDSAEETEKPPMPDLSNPNKVMSAEEIAALIANL